MSLEVPSPLACSLGRPCTRRRLFPSNVAPRPGAWRPQPSNFRWPPQVRAKMAWSVLTWVHGRAIQSFLWGADAVQAFPMPADLPAGRYLRVNLHGKRQQQLEDMQVGSRAPWVLCIRRPDCQPANPGCTSMFFAVVSRNTTGGGMGRAPISGASGAPPGLDRLPAFPVARARRCACVPCSQCAAAAR